MEGFGEKLFPFTVRNRVWAVRLLQGYGLSVAIGAVLAAFLNFNEGDEWMKAADKGQKVAAHDIRVSGTAFDECLWFTMTTLHGIGFGEFGTKSVGGDWIISLVVAVSYWCSIFMMAIVMMSQLPGVKAQSLLTMVKQMAGVAWPSYLIVVILTFIFGFIVGPYMEDGISPDPACKGSCEKKFNLLGVQWLWSVVHRAPFGDVWPDTPFGRVVTVPAGMISYLYPPYVLALIAIRRPTPTEHAELLAHMNAYPDEAMGPGYIVPASGPRDLEFVNMAGKDDA
mmetsp:Transcript_112250/g.210511  ORF Transcript_112250/g.210511 Transcript_112250/m.210511 type:complete len:282 (+) Transcript_112250:115-960(+)